MCRAVEVFHTNAISHAALVRAQELEHRENRLRQIVWNSSSAIFDPMPKKL